MRWGRGAAAVPATAIAMEPTRLSWSLARWLMLGCELHRMPQWWLDENVAMSLAKLPALGVHRVAARVRTGAQALLLSPTGSGGGAIRSRTSTTMRSCSGSCTHWFLVHDEGGPRRQVGLAMPCGRWQPTAA